MGIREIINTLIRWVARIVGAPLKMFNKQNKNNKDTAENTELVKPRKSETSKKACLFTLAASIAVIPTLASANIANAAENQSLENQTKSVILADDKKATGNGVNDSHDGNKSTTQVNDTIRVFIQLAKNKDKNKKLDLTKLSNGDARFIGKYLSNFYAPYGTQIANADGQMPKEVEESMIKNLTETVGIQEADAKTLVTWVKAQLVQGSTELEWKFSKDGNATSGSGMLESPTVNGKKAVGANPYEFMKIASGAYGAGSLYLPYDIDDTAQAWDGVTGGGNFSNSGGEGARTYRFNDAGWKCVQDKTGLSKEDAKNKYIDHEGPNDAGALHQAAFEDDNRGVFQHYGEERRTAWKIASCSESYAVLSGGEGDDASKEVIRVGNWGAYAGYAKDRVKYSKDELNFYKKTLEENENYAYLTDSNGHIAFKIDTTGEQTTASVSALMLAAQLSNPGQGYGNSFYDLLKEEYEKNKDNREFLSKATILDSKLKMSPFGDLLYQSGNTTTVVIPAILNPYGFEAKDHKPGDVLPAANSFGLAGTGYNAFSSVRNSGTPLAQCVMGSGHINDLRGKISGHYDGGEHVSSYRAVLGKDDVPWTTSWGGASDPISQGAMDAMTDYGGSKRLYGQDSGEKDGADRHNYAHRIPISWNNHDDGRWGANSNIFPNFWLGWHTRSLFDTYNRETTDCNGSVVVADLYKLYEGKDPKANLDEKSTFQVMHSLKDDGSMAIKQVPDFKEGTTFGIPKDGGGAYNLEGRAGLLDFNKVLDKNAAMTVYLTLLVQQHGKGTSLYDQLGMGSADSNLPPIKDDVKFDGLSEEQKQQNAKELENQIDNQLRWYMYYLMHPTKTKYKRELDKNSNIAYVSEAHANMIGANNQAGTTSASKFTGFVAYSAIPTTDDIKWTSGLKDMYFSQIHWVFAIILVVCLIYWIAGSLTLGQAIGSLIVLCFLFGTVTHVQDWAADKANGIVNNMYSSKFSYLGLVQEEAYADKIDEAAKGDSYNNYLQAQNEELQALEIDGENNPHTRGISNVTVKIQAPKKLQSLVVGGGKQDQELLDIAGNSQFGAVGLSAYTKSVSGQGFTENPNDTYLYRSYVDLSNFAKYTYLGVRPGSELVSGVEGHADTSKWTPSLRDAWNHRSQAWDQAVESGYNIPNKSGGVNSTKVVPALSSRIVTDAYASKESMGNLSLDQNVGIDTRRFNFGIVNYTKQHDFLSAVQKQTEANQTKKTNIKGRDKTVNAENAAPDKDKENKDNKDKKDDQKKQEEQQQQQQSSSGGGSSKPNPDAATLEGFQPDGGGKYTNLDYATLGAFAMYSESPFYYYYYNLADQGLNIDGGRGGYKDLLLGENSGGNYFYNTKGNGEMRDFNDSRELFTYVIPYLRQSNKSVNAFKELYGLHYHEGIPTTEGHWNDEGIRDDAVAQQKYWENLQTARLYGLYTPWVDLMETGRYAKETTIDVLGQKHTVKDPLDPASYPAERPMVFSRSEQLDNGLTDDQLTEVEKKIQEVQRNTAEKMLSLMNYYSFRDSTVDTAAALLTTFEFNKTFSERHWMDESLNLYPQSMDAKNISWDGYLRLILQTSEDGGGYDIGAEDFYDQIIRDQGVIFGWALVAVSALSGIGVPYLQWLVFFLLAVLSICRLVIILLRALPPLEVLKESGKHIGGPAIMMGLVFLIKNWLMSLMMSSGSTLVTGPLGNDGALVGMPVWGKIVLLLVIDLLSVGILLRLGFRIVGNIFGDIVTLKENFKGVLHDMKVNLSNARATGSFTGAISHIAGVRAERLEVAKQRSVPPPPNSVEGQMLRSASPLRRGGKNTARTTTAGGGDNVNYAAEASNRERRRGVTDSIKAAMAAGATGAVAGYGAGKKAVRVAKSAKRLTIGSVDKSKLNTTEKPVAQSKSDLQAAEERISNLATEKKKAENELLKAQQIANLRGGTTENQQAIRAAQQKVHNLNTEIGEANWRMNSIRRKVAEEERQINAEHKRKVGAEKGQQRKESRAEELKRVWRGIGKKSSNSKKDNT